MPAAAGPVPPPAARPAGLVVRPLTSADAEQIATWRYAGPWAVYDSRPEDGLVNREGGFESVVDSLTGDLVGFVCVGQEARVPGLAAEPGVTDVGVGMRPDLVGARVGSEFGAAVLSHLREQAGGGALRAVVLDWNERSQRLCRRLGFRPVGTHTCEQEGQQRTYVVLRAD